jgi:hypothetical protein
MNSTMKEFALMTVSNALNLSNNFDLIADNISKAFNEKYGNQWKNYLQKSETNENEDSLIPQFSLIIGNTHIFVLQRPNPTLTKVSINLFL